MKSRIMALSLLAAFGTSPARAQSSFEVVSIKPAPLNAGPRIPMQVDAGRVTYNNMTVKMIVQLAYGIPDWKITGGPDWADSFKYDIKGTFPAGVGPDQIPNMLKSVLTERFGFVAQLQTKVANVYALTQGKSGAKLKAALSEDEWRADGTMNGGIFRGRIVLHNLTMAGLAEMLARQVGRPVVDQTGLSGAFDINLKWTPVETEAFGKADDGPSIFTALQEQLGLRLQTGRVPIEFLVVKQVNKAPEN